MDLVLTKGCGCYDIPNKSTSLVIKHAISMKTTTHGISQMDYFSSFKKSKLCMSADILGPWNVYIIQLAKASINIINTLETFI